jgi:hypothetical protein
VGAASVRAAVTAFLRAQSIPGVGHVFSEWPYYVANATAFDKNNPSLLGQCALMVHLWQTHESRISLPAVTGQKARVYVVSLGILYRYMIPNNAGVQPDQDLWVAGLDAIIDGLRVAIESDPNLGNAAVIWQAGQEPGDLSTEIDLPVRDGGYVRILARMDMHVTEIVTA